MTMTEFTNPTRVPVVGCRRPPRGALDSFGWTSTRVRGRPPLDHDEAVRHRNYPSARSCGHAWRAPEAHVLGHCPSVRVVYARDQVRVLSHPEHGGAHPQGEQDVQLDAQRGVEGVGGGKVEEDLVVVLRVDRKSTR